MNKSCSCTSGKKYSVGLTSNVHDKSCVQLLCWVQVKKLGLNLLHPSCQHEQRENSKRLIYESLRLVWFVCALPAPLFHKCYSCIPRHSVASCSTAVCLLWLSSRTPQVALTCHVHTFTSALCFHLSPVTHARCVGRSSASCGSPCPCTTRTGMSTPRITLRWDQVRRFTNIGWNVGIVTASFVTSDAFHASLDTSNIVASSSLSSRHVRTDCSHCNRPVPPSRTSSLRCSHISCLHLHSFWSLTAPVIHINTHQW